MPTGFSISTNIVSIEKFLKNLRIHLDNCLNLNLHINNICKSALKLIRTTEKVFKF